MPEPIPTIPSTSFFDYQFHQVAIYVPDGIDEAVAAWKNLGYNDWIEDHADLVGTLSDSFVSTGDPFITTTRRPPRDVVTHAHMAFNYDIMPMELEFLHYKGESRWQGTEGRGMSPFISHMSTYVDDVVMESRVLAAFLKRQPFHRFITKNHSNPGVKGKKRFIESIFDTRSLLGYDLKMIQKVDWDYPDENWLGVDL
jgi:hypothetical protein